LRRRNIAAAKSLILLLHESPCVPMIRCIVGTEWGLSGDGRGLDPRGEGHGETHEANGEGAETRRVGD
jgi:hypothetical protein